MLIANPIYDSVFKYLMDDMEAVRALIAGILGETIERAEFCPQDASADFSPLRVSVCRFDFKAVILYPDETRRRVLVEIRKAKFHFDSRHYCRYEGANPNRIEVMDGKEESLPVVTIFFLGFNLRVEAPVIRVGEACTNAATGDGLHDQDDFIKDLAHDSHVVQMMRLPAHGKNKLERLLSIFSQEWRKVGENGWMLLYLPEASEDPVENSHYLLSPLKRT